MIDAIAEFLKERDEALFTGTDFDADDAERLESAKEIIAILKLGSRLTVYGVEAVVVPVEPSDDMMYAGKEKARDLGAADFCSLDAKDIYRAMLSAAGER
jgi:hypothetical protein